VVSTFGALVWQDTKSNTVIAQRLADLLSSTYEVVNDPTGTATDFFEPTGYWSPVPEAHNYPQAKQKGLRTAVCEEVVQYEYAPYATDAFGHDSDVELVPDCVQSPDCPENPQDPALPDETTGEFTPREDLDECVTYTEIDTWHYVVTLSATPRGGVQAASADDGGSGKSNIQATSANDGKHKAKKGGKHRGKGKRGR
jgi:hypothetical protein